MVKVERSFPAPASLALESQKANGSYSMPDVVKQLKENLTGIIFSGHVGTVIM